MTTAISCATCQASVPSHCCSLGAKGTGLQLVTSMVLTPRSLRIQKNDVRPSVTYYVKMILPSLDVSKKIIAQVKVPQRPLGFNQHRNGISRNVVPTQEEPLQFWPIAMYQLLDSLHTYYVVCQLQLLQRPVCLCEMCYGSNAQLVVAQIKLMQRPLGFDQHRRQWMSP